MVHIAYCSLDVDYGPRDGVVMYFVCSGHITCLRMSLGSSTRKLKLVTDDQDQWCGGVRVAAFVPDTALWICSRSWTQAENSISLFHDRSICQLKAAKFSRCSSNLIER